MFSSVQKRVKKLFFYIQNYIKIRDYTKKACTQVGATSVHFTSFGGADINYILKKGTVPTAMMRLGIIDNDKNNTLPIQRFNLKKRIDKEIFAYSQGPKKNLTPQLLGYNHNYTICSYIDGHSMFSIVKKDPSSLWRLLEQSLQLYEKLHMLDITHLDATFKNIFWDSNSNSFKIVDFEYYASKHFSLQKQKLYDYLRLVDYALRLSNDSLREEIERLSLIFKVFSLQKYQNISLTEVSSMLNTLRKHPMQQILYTQYKITL